jgi:hypothetical protein
MPFRDPNSGGKMHIVSPTDCVREYIVYVKGRYVPGNAYNRPREGTKHSRTVILLTI